LEVSGHLQALALEKSPSLPFHGGLRAHQSRYGRREEEKIRDLYIINRTIYLMKN
jgi:hypothetical protein